MSTRFDPSDPAGDPRRGPTGDTAVRHDTEHDTGDEAAYAEIQATPEFQQLKRSLRRFAFPATVAFLAWYLLYVLMSGYARGFMDTKLLGNINVAYVFGLLQFLSTFVIAYVYARYADRHLDPTADALRERIEGGHR